MSRRKSSSTTPSIPKENASHPQEHYPVYRSFLIRSLDRCDTELAALQQLNRSLHSAKADILETCGEATLLDIGEGLLTLAPNRDDLEGKLPPQGHDVCINFLLRMKLRRKLLNRLSRRLGRLAHAMDGEDVQPPAPPKYGDLRLFIEPNAVKAFSERLERQERALGIMDMRNESYIPVEKQDDEPTTEEAKPAADKKETETVESGKEEAKVDDKAPVTSEKESEKEPVSAMEETKDNEKASVAEKSSSELPSEKTTLETKSGTEDVEMSEANTPEKPAADTGSKPEEPKSGGEAKHITEEAKPSDAPTGSKPEDTKSAAAEQLSEESKPNDDQPPEAISSEAHLTDEDYIDSLRDYDEAYTKKTLPSTGAVKYPILERDTEDDHNRIKYGGGIGATHRTMSAKDKELEFKRWQTEVLQRIPDQPSFQELGLANRVFFLEGRRKRLAEEEAKSPPKKKRRKKDESDSDSDDTTPSPKKKKAKKKKDPNAPKRGMNAYMFFANARRPEIKAENPDIAFGELNKQTGAEFKALSAEEKKPWEEKAAEDKARYEREMANYSAPESSDDSSDESSDDDVEMAEADDEDDDDDDFEADRAKEKDDNEDESDDDDDEKPEAKDDTKAETAIAKPVKPISLAAVPSFHEQDMKRLRMIHAELMATSMHEHARLRIGEATKEYNHAYRNSNDLYNLRGRLQAELNQVSQETRMKIAQLKSEYLLDASVHRKNWEKRHREHALASLPSAQGHAVRGTPRTASAANHPNAILSNVGKALGEIVDCVAARGDAGWKYESPIEEYKPPPEPDYSKTLLSTGETLGQRQQRKEGGLRKQLTEVATRLHLNEEERKRTWKKLLKVKSEFETPYNPAPYSGSRGQAPYGGQYQTANVPSLHASSTAAMPSYPMSSVASYVPPATASLLMANASRPASESKYSAAKVRERHAADGSVAPASEPKKTEDGRFIRPAGRGRTGMEWDEVRGLWIPLKRS